MAAVLIYGFPVSTWTRTVRMVCVEKDLEYELLPVAYGSDEHGLLHPFRRMPIVEAGGRRLFETLAISGYLDEAFEGASLQPQDLDERALMRTWMAICSDYLFRDVVRGIPRRRDPTEEELTAARTALERAEGLMRPGPFLAGASLSLADLYLAPQLANCDEKAPQLLEGLEGLRGWIEVLSRRRSFIETAPDAPA